MKKYLLLFIAIVVLGAGAYFSELQFLSYSHPNASETTVATQGDPSTILLRRSYGAGTLQSQGVTLAVQSATSATPADVDFTLSANGKTYRGSVHTGATVLEAMKAIPSESGFAFVSKDFPGMGAFVESINGKVATDGYYWILYVNGVQAQQGISSTVVRSGDKIEWKYDKVY